MEIHALVLGSPRFTLLPDSRLRDYATDFYEDSNELRPTRRTSIRLSYN